MMYELHSGLTCALCENEIDVGEQYIENEDHECAHIMCLDSVYDVLDFLGIDIETALAWYGED